MNYEALKQRDLAGNPLITLGDVANLNEILLIDYQNEKRSREKAKRQAERNRG